MLKKFVFPQDYHTLLQLTIACYQYAAHPEWGVPTNLGEMLEPQYLAFRSVYPYMQLLAQVDKRLKTVMGGVLAIEGKRPIGVALLLRLYESPRFELGNVGVVPAWRRKGIARQMVEACIAQARAGGGKRVELNVIEGNRPPQRLYESMDFDTLYHAHELTHYQPLVPLIPHLPDGYRARSVRFGDGTAQAELAARLGLPAEAGRYTLLPGLRWLAWLLFARSSMGSWRRAVYAPDGALVAEVGIFLQPGTSTAHFLLDTAHGQLAPILLQHMLHRAARFSYGMPLALTLIQEEWLGPAQALGFAHEFVHRRMALTL